MELNLTNKPALSIPKREQEYINQLESETIILNKITPMDFKKIYDWILGIYYSFRRKSKIKLMTISYTIGNSPRHEICFKHYLSALKGGIAKTLYDYDLFVCINKPEFEFMPPMIFLHSISAYKECATCCSNPFIKECRRMSKIKGTAFP